MDRVWTNVLRFGSSLVLACASLPTAAGQEPSHDLSDAPEVTQLGESTPHAASRSPTDDQDPESPPRVGTSPAAERRPDPRGDNRSPVGFTASWIPGRPVQGQPTDLALGGWQANLAVPVRIAPDGRAIWLATSGVDYLRIESDAILPDSRLAVPDELWKLSVGAMHFREFDDGYQAGGIFSIGTASDQPFADLRDLTLMSLVFVNIPRGPRDAWNFSLFYSPTSQLPYPIPGAAYVWRPNERFSANLGVPFAMRYQPTEAWTFTADYRPLTAVRLQARRALFGDWSVYTRYEIVNETYWLAERANSHDRLYLFDQRAALGIERRLPAGFALDLNAAYVFDRSLFQAESFSDGRRDILEIAPGAAISLLLSWSR